MSKLKNIVFYQVVIILILVSALIAQQWLIDKMTENNSYGYTMSLTK